MFAGNLTTPFKKGLPLSKGELNYSTVTPEIKDYSALISETYKKPRERTGDLELSKKYTKLENDNSHYTVYTTDPVKSNERRTNYLVYRGTRKLHDLKDDAKILIGTEKFGNDVETMKNLQKKYPDSYWKVIGHSLGATKALIVGQKTNSEVHAFNPGYSYMFENKIDPSRKKNNIYVVDKDHLSKGLLYEKSKGTNVKVFEGNRWHPYENHSISYYS